VHGTLSGTAPDLSYLPDPDYAGPDSFTYTVSDGLAMSEPATVTITVRPVNDPPVAADDDYATDEDTVLTVSAPGVAGNDADPDGDALAVSALVGPAHGALVLDADGSFTYTPDADYAGSDSFGYRATDGTLVGSTATVSLTVRTVNDAPALSSALVVPLDPGPVNAVAPAHVQHVPALSSTVGTRGALDNWIVFEVLGVVVGGALGAWSAGRFGREVMRGATFPAGPRIALAISGGVLMGFAAKLARGCTSGQALSGGALMSVGAWAFMLSVFVGGYGAAYFVRRQWR
jgi:VCBS repeat-containing protein